MAFISSWDVDKCEGEDVALSEGKILATWTGKVSSNCSAVAANDGFSGDIPIGSTKNACQRRVRGGEKERKKKRNKEERERKGKEGKSFISIY